MNGRTSPIQSPPRRSRDELSYSTDSRISFLSSPTSTRVSTDTASMRDPPPSYNGEMRDSQVSPARSTRSNGTEVSSRYSSLMQYLNDQDEDADIPGVEYDDAHGDGDGLTQISSMSLSPNSHHRRTNNTSKSKSGNKQYHYNNYTLDRDTYKNPVGGSSIASGRTFVWDGEEKGAPMTSETDNLTYFSQTRTYLTDGGGSSLSPRGERAHNDNMSASQGSLSDAMTHVTDQFKDVKILFTNTSNKAKELQNQLMRLNQARKRKATKCRQEWSFKLQNQRVEQEIATKRIKDFVGRLEVDVKKLSDKKSSLEEKYNKICRQRDTTLQLLKEDISRKSRHARKQWDIEEKAIFEKQLLSKRDSIRKTAAEAYGPALDKMVEDGKLEVRQKEDAVQMRLDALRRKLNLDLDRKLQEAKDTLRDELRIDEETARRSSERKLEEALKAQGVEIEHIKDKFGREKKVLEETLERTRRLNTESTLEGIREVRSSENKQISELMTMQQKELSQMASQHAHNLDEYRLQLIESERDSLATVRTQLEEEIQTHKRRTRNSAKAKAMHETERILTRLKEDVTMERSRIKEGIDKELEDLRLEAHTVLESRHQSERRSTERAAAMRGEIESYRKEISILESTEMDKKEDLSKMQSRLSSLRIELREVEEQISSTELESDRERNDLYRKQSREFTALEEEESACKQALHREEVAVVNRKEDARVMYSDDLSRIRDKVQTLLQRRDDQARDMQRSLLRLQEESSLLQESLDSYRAQQYSRVATSVDSDDAEVDILKRLNIGNIDATTGRRHTESSSDNDGGGGRSVSSQSTRASAAPRDSRGSAARTARRSNATSR